MRLRELSAGSEVTRVGFGWLTTPTLPIGVACVPGPDRAGDQSRSARPHGRQFRPPARRGCHLRPDAQNGRPPAPPSRLSAVRVPSPGLGRSRCAPSMPVARATCVRPSQPRLPLPRRSLLPPEGHSRVGHSRNSARRSSAAKLCQ